MSYTDQQIDTAAVLLAQEVDLLHSLMNASPDRAETIKNQIREIWSQQVSNGVSLDFLVCRLRGQL